MSSPTLPCGHTPRNKGGRVLAEPLYSLAIARRLPCRICRNVKRQRAADAHREFTYADVVGGYGIRCYGSRWSIDRVESGCFVNQEAFWFRSRLDAIARRSAMIAEDAKAVAS